MLNLKILTTVVRFQLHAEPVVADIQHKHEVVFCTRNTRQKINHCTEELTDEREHEESEGNIAQWH